MAPRKTERTAEPLFAQAAVRRKPLFLPKRLEEEGRQARLDGADLEQAFAVLKRWADLESGGRLARAKETSLDAEFLNEVFGQALHYTSKTDDPDRYNLERQFPVPNVGSADGAIGMFPLRGDHHPVAVIELKSFGVNLDRDRSNGRTAVQQLWDYLNALEACPWGIVSNFSEIRLYHRDRGTQSVQRFLLQDLRDLGAFRRFYAVLERGGLLPGALGQEPRAERLLRESAQEQQEVGDKLYKYYADQRLRLVAHLHREHHPAYTLDRAIRAAQKLIDRIVFIAFCEDRDLLPEKTIERTYKNVPPYSRATNPRWRNFLDLFHVVDKGRISDDFPTGYNGGLFATDPDVDELQLPDEPWALFFNQIGTYDFRDTVNVDVLGHLFERSINDLERLRAGGLFGENDPDARRDDGPAHTKPGRKRKAPSGSVMPKSAERKRGGIYYTPPSLTGLLIERTVVAQARERFAAAAAKHGVDPANPDAARNDKRLAWARDCLASLRSLKICDPACGSGAFLIRAYDALEDLYGEVVETLEECAATDAKAVADAIPDFILADNLHGVDLSPEGVEITQLALWIRSARRGRTLANLSANIICGNSLVADPAVDPRALDWKAAFPAVFSRPGDDAGFDVVVGNPPWERVKLQEREFFAASAPEVAQSVSAADRRKRIAAMEKKNPELFALYTAALARADAVLAHARSGPFPLTGKGDLNLYALFAERALSLVGPGGLVGLLTPSGIATDESNKRFFAALVDGARLHTLYDFENKKKLFPDVDGRFKFAATIYGGSARSFPEADFAFFLHDVKDLEPASRHIPLAPKDFRLFNPNTRTCPIFRTRRDAEVTRTIYRRVPVLVDETRKAGGNPWGVRFFTMFHQTNDAEHFREPHDLEKEGFKARGNRYVKGTEVFLPLYEGKMIEAYDHRFGSMFTKPENWIGQGQNELTSDVQHANPEYVVQPRWWVSRKTVKTLLAKRSWEHEWLLGFRDISNSTNRRTYLGCMLPLVAATNKVPVIMSNAAPLRTCCMLACLLAVPYDYVLRQKMGGISLNFFIVEQLPILPPEAYDEKCPWDRRVTLEKWVSERVLKLSCTAVDMIPLAEACGFKGSEGNGVHRWNPRERAELRAELDAAYFLLYGIDRDDAAYILSTFQGMDEPPEDFQASPSVAAIVLEAYDRLSAASRA